MGTSIFYFLNSLSQRKMSTIKKRKKKVEKRKEKRKARTMPKNTHGHFGQLKHWAFLPQVFFSFLGENILVTQRKNT